MIFQGYDPCLRWELQETHKHKLQNYWLLQQLK